MNIYMFLNPITRTFTCETEGVAAVRDDYEVDAIVFKLPSVIENADPFHDTKIVSFTIPGSTRIFTRTLDQIDSDANWVYVTWPLTAAMAEKVGTIRFALLLKGLSQDLSTITTKWRSQISSFSIVDTLSGSDTEPEEEEEDTTTSEKIAALNSAVFVLQSQIDKLVNGAPVVVSSVAEMTDTAQIYVLSTDGNWYYHNGTAWVAGGTYGAVGTDRTLTQAGIPADAETVGIRINAMSSDIEEIRDDLDNLDIETDTTLSIAGKPADAKAVGDALAEAMTGESLADGESMKYVLSSKYDDFKMVNGYGYFDAVQLLNYGYGGPAPYQRGSNNIIFRIGYGNRSWLSPNYLTDGLFSPDFPIENIPWAGPAATADPSFMGSLPEGFYITIPNNPVRRGNRFVAVPKSVYGDSATFGEFVASYLDGSIGVKMDSTRIREYDPSEVISAITSGGNPSAVTIDGETIYKGFITWTWSDVFDFENTTANNYRMYSTFGLTGEIKEYAKDCVWFERTTRLWYRVRADAVGERTFAAVKDYLLNTKHLKFYYVSDEEVTA